MDSQIGRSYYTLVATLVTTARGWMNGVETQSLRLPRYFVTTVWSCWVPLLLPGRLMLLLYALSNIITVVDLLYQL